MGGFKSSGRRKENRAWGKGARPGKWTRAGGFGEGGGRKEGRGDRRPGLKNRADGGPFLLMESAPRRGKNEFYEAKKKRNKGQAGIIQKVPEGCRARKQKGAQGETREKFKKNSQKSLGHRGV